jgi:transposase
MQVTTIGLDLAKSVFQVHGEDAQGNGVVRKRLRRAQVLRWFANVPACLVGIEACGGAHYWARALTPLGHTVRIIPPQYVRPFVKTNKSDTRDAQAICRAVRAPDMVFVPLASPADQDLQALHRVRARLVKERTALCNQTRGLLLEYGLTVPKGGGRLRRQVQQWLGAPPAEITASLLRIIQEQYSELLAKDDKFADYTARIEAAVKADLVGQRLLAIPGSQVPALAEPWFLNFSADCRFRVVMSPKDLQQAGLEEIGRKRA